MWKGSVFNKKLSKDMISNKPRAKVGFAICVSQGFLPAWSLCRPRYQFPQNTEGDFLMNGNGLNGDTFVLQESGIFRATVCEESFSRHRLM